MSETAVVVAGTDDYDIADAIASEDYEIERVDVAKRPALEEAGLLDAAVYVLTEVAQATSIPVARELNPDLRIVVYADGSLQISHERRQIYSLTPSYSTRRTWQPNSPEGRGIQIPAFLRDSLHTSKQWSSTYGR
jgi:hypothetical protein